MSARPPDQTTDRAGNQPLVWHYGLMAERWGEFLHETPELPFLLAQVERFGQPVLDLCCGAGRLTVPLRKAGIDVHGCDISPDMIEHIGRFRTLDIDPLEQTYTREVRLEKRRDGELISEEQYALRGGAYMKPEVLLMLQVAGFRAEDIATRGDYRDEPATADSEKVVFIARRAAA